MTTSAVLGLLRVYGLMGIAAGLAAFVVGVSGFVRVAEQVTFWLKEAVWQPDPLLVQLGPILTGLKGIDVIIVSILNRFSTGVAALIVAFVLLVLSMLFISFQRDADWRRAKIKAEKHHS